MNTFDGWSSHGCIVVQLAECPNQFQNDNTICVQEQVTVIVEKVRCKEEHPDTVDSYECIASVIDLKGNVSTCFRYYQ